MSTMADVRRSTNNPINNRIICGKSDSGLSPSVTEREDVFYTVRCPSLTRIVKTIHEVNAILAKYPNAKVVKTTKTTTVRTSHKRVR